MDMKTIITLIFLFISSLTFAQKLVVTPIGLKNESDNEKTYVKTNALQILLKYRNPEDLDKIVNNVDKIKELDYMFENVEDYKTEEVIAKQIIDSL